MIKHQFGVTIATSLEASDICDTKKFHHVCVFDLRRCLNNGPFPIEEATLRRLHNFRVAYEQLPTSMYSANTRQENDLLRCIQEQQGNVMVITDHPVPLARFCQDFDIPFRSRDLYIVETARDYVPVQVRKHVSQGGRFGSFGG